ncbi:hypothetical protein JDV02_003930 [Purpureocillium takamizusanense]|uniref:Uncharacterized protein n=1 Tax=Purpureocillium takamizusanense TaxID=2060973 RepID=A0A9Q8V9C6_9HYPO|nr:uncharacterized protein JDV02_003930 [Purpureocillium takamizusanense]UNI17598.1 hypothetical protein JDV02_003930 [Purpureocillium takamizusanense]
MAQRDGGAGADREGSTAEALDGVATRPLSLARRRHPPLTPPQRRVSCLVHQTNPGSSAVELKLKLQLPPDIGAEAPPADRFPRYVGTSTPGTIRGTSLDMDAGCAAEAAAAPERQ